VNSVNQPEANLLLCCARNGDSDLNGRIQEILLAGVDWTLVANLADRHRVTPLVYRQLSRIAPDVLAQPALRPIVERFFGIAKRNLHLTKELLLLVDLLRKNEIVAVSFKGPLLAVSAFGDLCWREFGDLDLLLRSADIPKAKGLLESRGYRPEIKLDGAIEAAFIRSEHHFQYLRDEDHLIVELHWRLQDRYLKFPFDTDALWNSVCSRDLFGNAIASLSPETLFLYLCMHGAKHCWERLEWIACLPAVIRAHPDMKWPLVIEMARSLGGLRILRLGLLLANRLDASEATQAPLSMIERDPVAEDLAETVWATLFADELDGSRREVYRFRFYLKARERLGDRLSVVRFATIHNAARGAASVPHPDSIALDRFPLHNSLLFLQYLLRPLRLLRRYGLSGLVGILNPSRIPLNV
jgi:hypothetical protein